MQEKQSNETSLKETVPSKNLFAVRVNEKIGFIDTNGKIVIEPQFQGAREFVDSRAVVAVNDDKYKQGYIDETGKFAVTPQFDAAQDFSEGLAAVGIGFFGIHGDGNHKWGFVDRNGTMIINPQFREVKSFSEGFAAVMNADGKWGFIDKAGKLVIPFQFEDAFNFSEDLACVLTDGLFGFIDKSGTVVIAPQFSLPSYFKEGLAGVKIGDKNNKPYKSYSQYVTPVGAANGKVIFIDKTGKTVIELADNVKEANSFSEGLARIQVEKKEGFPFYGFIDKTGKTVIDPIYLGFAQDFSEGLALVEYKDKIGFIDKTGKMIIKPEYSWAESFHNGLAYVEKGKSALASKAKLFYIDKTGKVIWQGTK
ncbi:MAG: WG repeat-containing protein [Pyrinomonadaceae bacterium]